MNDLLHDAAGRAIRYLATLDARPVAPGPEEVARLEALGGALPEHPSDPAAVLALLDELGSPATVASAGRRYFGFVTGGALPAALAASWLATAWDQNTALRVMSPAGAALEDIAGAWIVELLGLPRDTAVGFVTGATMANLAGLAAARHALLDAAGWDVEAQGLFGAPPITVVVGEEVHVSLLKALGLLGLGRERVLRVPVDGLGRMRADALPALSGPAIICAQAGNVNTGAIDPLDEICDAAQAAGAWVHVDGAFGLWAAAAPARAHLARGVARADSWATDAHKWLNVPYDSGVVLVRQAQHLRAAMTVAAAYLSSGQAEPSHYSPEMSRRARGAETWAAIRSLGRSGVAELIERTCRLAVRFAAGLRAAGYEVLNAESAPEGDAVMLNQVLVSFGSDDDTRRVVAALQAEGTLWCGATVWQGRAAMRISVSSWATTEADVDRCLAVITRVAG